MKTRVHIIVRGVVQGVFFRYSTQREAQGLGLTGWVRNLPDGGVEIVCEGEEEAVEKLVQWSRKGPGGAFVEHTDVSREDHTGGFLTFEIRY
ncbi:MAG: acylphosphatase [Syntrophorhabdaceae bacterium]|nr:acylphosphatase [Syntrophorhabdaceae bacterium]